MKEVLRYSNCFVCGDLNPGGLKAKFFFDGKKAYTEIATDSRFEGYKGIYHGGVLSSLLDEIMIKAILANETYAVTAEMTVRFLLPVKTGDKLSITGWVRSHKGRLYLTEGEAVNSEGQMVASASGKYVEAKPELKALLKRSVAAD